MKFQTYLIKYGEIGIKGKNRYMFEDALVRQIRHSLKDLDGLFHTYKAQGRVYVDCDGDYDGDEVVEALKRVFGIVGICPVVRVEDKGFEELKKNIKNALECHFDSKEDIPKIIRLHIVRDEMFAYA